MSTDTKSQLVVAKKADDQGWGSKLHEEKAGEIVFSTKQVDVKNPSNLETSFDSMSSIVGRAYLKASVANMKIGGEDGENMNSMVDVGMFITIDGNPHVTNSAASFTTAVPGAAWSFSIKGDQMYKYTSFSVWLKPPQDYEHKAHPSVAGPAQTWNEAVQVLSEGTHKATVALRVCYNKVVSDPLAVGSFDLVIGDGGPVSVDFGRGLPEAKFTDDAMAKEMAASLPAGGFKYPVKKVSIQSTGWQLFYDESFVPKKLTKRTKDTYVAFGPLPEWDNKCKVFNISFKQDSIGPEQWGPLSYNAVGSSYVASPAKC
eukprot:TRINITY_DN6136_c0_g1_i1.p1 TRINITY_DN6136_c0_g1~~TRINITY_DN6136_c0_g1_i1.p1  ORF type:complete len:328 (+),score=75.28 TRINITY_DN6136_c0_g1_i1:42-986(+)